VAALLAAGLGLQLYFFAEYPRPVLFGDPAGYYKVGERLQEAWARLQAGDDAAAVFESVRGTAYLGGVGAVFAVLDGLRPQDWGFVQRVFGVFNVLAMLGAFQLGRRLAGRFAGGAAALALAAAYPTFSVQTGRLYPDPITGCLFVWAAWLYAEALERGRARWMAGAGLLLALALVIRTQLIAYMGLVIGAALAATARAWARSPRGRRLVLAFVVGCAPAALAWGFATWAVGDRDDVVQLGNATFRPLYPYGFWQFLETDGWIGPYRFKTEPYYRSLEAAGREDPRLMRSRARQWAFTARYVAARPLESTLLVLDNAYRLFDRPANDYKWDYPVSYPWQVAFQRMVVVLAVAGAALFTARRPALGGVFLLPAALAVLHGLVFPWPRYNVPVMPILLATAGAGAVSLWERTRAGPRPLLPPMAAALAVALLVAAAAVFPLLPGAARLARWAGVLTALGVPFLLVARAAPLPRGRLAAAAGFAVLAVPFTAHAVRDRLWHQTLTAVGGDEVKAVEQEIVLGPEAIAALRAAPEAFLVMDLRVPRGDLSRARVHIGQRELPGTALAPTMPRLRESTSTGGRDWRGYPQWWALPFDVAWLPPAGEPLRIRLSSEDAPLLLGGDRFAGQERTYEGPSFGDWPHVVALKLEYDGDYRIPVTRRLESAGTRSFEVDARGRRRELRSVHRIRLVTLRNNEGSLYWRTAALPRSGTAALAFSAWSGHRGKATLYAGTAPDYTFPLNERRPFELGSHGARLCYRFEGERGEKAYGSFALVGPVDALGTPGAPLRAHLRFQTGMSDVPMFFVIDRKRALPETVAALGTCVPAGATIVTAADEILDATRNNYPEDTGRWGVDRVF
jgi:4-amino-4-deoxy-L-arabinose transferase-like glycosyltransferase